ncbi:MAG: hypothetical protein COC23_04740 [Hyphomicrobiales bacterium]|nr:MAG: hypothetical protein COC23_04740 [Hyphomicrobiales bacterium]
MSTLLTINVKNLGSSSTSMYFFQKPAIYKGGPIVYTNSLFHELIGSFEETSSILTFKINMQFYAGIQQANTSPKVGECSGYSTASRKIDLKPAKGDAKDFTTAQVDPLGLAVPTKGSGVEPGAFRIKTPIYSPPNRYNVGSAVSANGGIVLSNFVEAYPNTYTDCLPILKFYVQTGTYTPGTVMDFDQSSVDAAECDFTGGHSIIDVTRKNNGTWDTEIIA